MKARQFTAIILGLGIVVSIFSGCKSPSQNEIETSNGTGAASSEQQIQDSIDLLNDKLISGPYSLSDNLNSTIIMDASNAGKQLLCNHDGKYYVAQIGETGERVSSISVRQSDDIRLTCVDENARNTYLAGTTHGNSAVWKLCSDGEIELVYEYETTQTPLDLLAGSAEDYYMILGTVVEIPALDTISYEDTVLLHFDSQGNLIRKIELDITERMTYLFSDSSEHPFLITNRSAEEGPVTVIYAISEDNLSEYDSFSFGSTCLLRNGSNDHLYLSANGNLYQYDLAEKVLEEQLKWVNSNVNGNSLSGGIVVSADAVIIWGNSQAWILQPRDESAETITIRVAAIEPNTLPVQELLDFQSNYPNITIETVMYSDQTALNLALAVGEQLDLLQIDGMDTRRYERAGYLQDLKDRFDQDEYLNLQDFYSKIWELHYGSQTLPTVITNFNVQGLYGPAANEQIEPYLDWETFDQITENSRFYETTVQENALIWLCSVSLHGDTNNATSLDRDELGREIATAKLFQKDFESVDYNISGTELPLLWLNGASFQAVSRIKENGNRLWGTDDLSFWGYPSSIKQGLSFSCTRSYGILSCSEHPDETWMLLRYIMLSGNDDVGIPILRQKDQPILDELIALVDNEALVYNSPVMEIILEEAGAYLNGDRQLEDVVDLIENRVRIFLSEQS